MMGEQNTFVPKEDLENERMKYYEMKKERDNALQLLLDVLQDNEMVGNTTPPTLDEIEEFIKNIKGDDENIK